jgi:hypothetical protein
MARGIGTADPNTAGSAAVFEGVTDDEGSECFGEDGAVGLVKFWAPRGDKEARTSKATMRGDTDCFMLWGVAGDNSGLLDIWQTLMFLRWDVSGFLDLMLHYE